MLKFLEWLGFLICLGSIICNGIIRNNSLSNTLWINITFVSMFVGGIITIIAYLFRKLGNNEKKKVYKILVIPLKSAIQQ